MTLNVTTTLQCDGCSGGLSVLTTGYTIDGPPQGKRGWKSSRTPTQLGWKQFRKSSTGLRRDFCPECVKAGRAK